MLTEIADIEEAVAVQQQLEELEQADEEEKEVIKEQIALIEENALEEKAAQQSEGSSRKLYFA